MTEPQHITMARQVLAQEGIDREGELYRSAVTLIEQRESNIEAGSNTTADGLKEELAWWQKKYEEDNGGLMFQLGRNLEFAQQVSFRHGATEPHATIKCIQIIDERACELDRQLKDSNTTAERLRKAIVEARECLENGCQGRAGEILRDALGDETWNR